MAATATSLEEFITNKAHENGGKFRSENPWLGTAGEPQIGSRVSEFLVVGLLSENEYKKYKENTNKIREFSNSKQLFEIVNLNFDSYEETTEKVYREFVGNYKIDSTRASSMTTNINRQILNFLTAMRTFLDHTETTLKRNHGENSSHYKKFRSSTATCYDSTFSYRFIYKLRNYTQHCGMPLGRINASLDAPKEVLSHKIDFYFDKNSLLNRFGSWGNPVKSELEKMPEFFPIYEHIQNTRNCLENIFNEINEKCIFELRNAISGVDQLLQKIPTEQGTPCIYNLIDVTLDARQRVSKSTVTYERFQMHEIEIIRRLIVDAAKKEQRKPSWQRYAETWDRMFGRA